MARLAKNQPTSRLTLDLAQAVKTRLEELRNEVGADTMTEVVRRALSLYDYIVTAKKGGAAIILKKGEQEHAVEFF